MDVALHIDQSVLLWLNGFARHSLALDKTIVLLTDSDFLKGGFFFLFFCWLWFRGSGDVRKDRLDTIRIALEIMLCFVVARALQIALPGRMRPLHDQTLPFVLPFTAPTDVLEHWSSFPSDHAVIFFALGTAIIRRYRLVGALAYLWFAAFALVPRIYTGLHYPSDIVAGALIGAGLMAAMESLPMPAIAAAIAERSVLAWERRKPAVFYVASTAVVYEFMTLFDDLRLIGRGLAKVLF